MYIRPELKGSRGLQDVVPFVSIVTKKKVLFSEYCIHGNFTVRYSRTEFDLFLGKCDSSGLPGLKELDAVSGQPAFMMMMIMK